MVISSRFAVAVHILTLLARSRGEPVTSDAVAASANTNAAVIRRLECMLARAGLTRARLGPGGGALLARPAAEITLLDVYRAVEDGELFARHAEPEGSGVRGRSDIHAALEETTDAARRALEEVLAGQTVADVLARVEGGAGVVEAGAGGGEADAGQAGAREAGAGGSGASSPPARVSRRTEV